MLFGISDIGRAVESPLYCAKNTFEISTLEIHNLEFESNLDL